MDARSDGTFLALIVVLGIEGRGYREFDRRRRTMIYGRNGRKKEVEEKGGKDRKGNRNAVPIGVSAGANIRENRRFAHPRDPRRTRGTPPGTTIASTDRSRDASQETRRNEKAFRWNRSVSLWELGVVFTVG